MDHMKVEHNIENELQAEEKDLMILKSLLEERNV